MTGLALFEMKATGEVTGSDFRHSEWFRGRKGLPKDICAKKASASPSSLGHERMYLLGTWRQSSKPGYRFLGKG